MDKPTKEQIKDTILAQEKRTYYREKAQKGVEDYYQIENPNNYPFVPKWLDEHAKQLCRDIALEELTEQAEITWDIAFKAGMKEVVCPKCKGNRFEISGFGSRCYCLVCHGTGRTDPKTKGYVKLAEDQSLPDKLMIPFYLDSEYTISSKSGQSVARTAGMAYAQSQQDMLKAGWRKVIIPKER